VAGTPPYFNNAYGDYYYLRPGHYAFKIPDGISDDVAAPVNCALSQVVYSLRRAGLGFGHTVVIQGAGGLGIHAVGVARAMGAETIIVFDRIPARLALARAFGADHALSVAELATLAARVEAVMALTGGFGADLVADLVGYPDVIPEGLRMLRSGGCYLEVGNISPGSVFSYDASQLIRGSARLVATAQYSPWAIPQALAYIRRNAGRFPFERIVSHTFPLERISEGFRQAEWLQRDGAALSVARAAISM
jgi:threonine dehydrogenase-like Zn-dependent dehydrogenase